MSAVMICSAAANSGAAVFAADADNAVTVSKEAASVILKYLKMQIHLLIFVKIQKLRAKTGQYILDI